MKNKYETKVVTTVFDVVCCNGEDDIMGHPLVYLHIKEHESSVTCPYCGVIFKYAKDT